MSFPSPDRGGDDREELIAPEPLFLPLPFPSFPPSLSDEEPGPVPDDNDFRSTTTQPLPLQDEPRPRASSPSASSALNRGRPATTSRPSSFFGADAQDDYQPRTSSEWGGTERAASADWARGDNDSEREGARSRAGSFFGLPPSPGADSTFGDLKGPPLGPPPNGAGPAAAAKDDERARRSSFYGLESHIPPSNDERPSGPYSNKNLHHQNGGDSGSGSLSSHDAPRGSAAGAIPRYHTAAPYAASRAASLYGIASSGDFILHTPAPLLDQSHLQPGALASLLSHDKTLELYRTNAKKTNDPDVQFEFCTFVMEVVGEMEETEAQRQALAGTTPLPQDPDAKQKQQALVAESVALLSKLAHRGHVKSQYFLADCYTQGIGTAKGKRDYDKAFPLFVLAGKHGHADACFRAAQCCEFGWGCKRENSKAVTLLRRASVLSHPGAMHRLGLAEINGELGLTKRPREGVKWLKRAAELADAVDPPQPQSLHELAMLSEKGIDNVIFKDEEYAAELLARASELGYAPSAYKLGECYEYGKMGCPQDSALSIHYYNIAAQQNHREACFALTAWYLVGSPGVLPQSDTEAYLWARKAADMGLAKAEYAVGYFTEVGIGTHKDPREALEWFNKAANQGDKRAKDRLRMTGQKAFARPDPPPPPPAKATAPLPLPPPPPLAVYKPPPRVTTTNKMQKRREDPPTRPQSVDRGGEGRGKGKAVDRSANGPGAGRGEGRRGGQNGADNNYGRHAPIGLDPDGRPTMQRQRSHSQPTPMDPEMRYAPMTYGEPDQGGYGAAQNGNGNGNGGARSVSDTYGGAGRGGESGGNTFRPIQPGQARMPQRQQRSGLGEAVEGEQVQEERIAHRDRVLLKGKRGPEDKDCIVM